ncbi:MAG: hypothetical protein B7Y13_03600, partial [Sulfurovum sp. 24-42-9]
MLFKSDIKLIAKSGLFDKEYYITSNLDVKEAGIDPLKHFTKHGWKEGRNPSTEFNTNFYLSTYTDVAERGINPLVHYIKYGKKEGRKTNTLAPATLKPYRYSEPALNEAIYNNIGNFTHKPLISIIMPVYNVDPKWLDLAIRSIEAQWYENWELCIADDKSTNPKTINYLKNIKNS